MVWQFTEDYIVGKFYLAHKESWRSHIDELMAELQQVDSSREKGSVRMRVQNFESLHTGAGLSNAAMQSKQVYGALMKRVQNSQEYSALQTYIEENYAPNTGVDSSAFTGTTSTTAFVPIEPIGPSFQELLFKFIDDRNMKDSEVYRRSCVGRDVFSNIRNGKGASKRTIKQLCFGLKLSYEDAVILLASAGYAFSNNDIGDLVVAYFLKNKIYDIYEANIELYERKQALLF
jgi:hypothetical protein